MAEPTITIGDVLKNAPPMRRLTDKQQTERIRALLDQAATFARPCKVCGRPLWFIRTKQAELMPYTDDASPHWADCPGADELRRRRPTQANLPLATAQPEPDPVDR
ncbi:MAG: hypothetical protein IT382_01840 [Deltaproteobacteria bacterium]|nr:hypothetical protein [Deltaproteobacteria bacterium]